MIFSPSTRQVIISCLLVLAAGTLFGVKLVNPKADWDKEALLALFLMVPVVVDPKWLGEKLRDDKNWSGSILTFMILIAFSYALIWLGRDSVTEFVFRMIPPFSLFGIIAPVLMGIGVFSLVSWLIHKK